MHNEISASVWDALRILMRDRLGKETSVVPGLHFLCEVLEQPHKFQKVYDLLADDESRMILAWLIKYKIGTLLCQTKAEVETLFPPLISRYEWHCMGQRSKQIPETTLEQNLEIDVIENFLLDGYNLPGICGVEPGDIVLDLGAFNGNSSIVFSRSAGADGAIYAFEPNPTMQEVLSRNLAKTSCTNVEVVPRGVSEKTAVLKFKVAGAGSRIDPAGQVEVQVGRVDNFVVERGLSKVDFIKLDIEGYEMPALRGAASTIRTFRPKLAVSVYHLHYDIHAVTLFIRDVCPWYQFYLRHNAMHDGEVVLFCRPMERKWASGTGVGPALGVA
jgi:FkbM family methyltransferase